MNEYQTLNHNVITFANVDEFIFVLFFQHAATKSTGSFRLFICVWCICVSLRWILFDLRNFKIFEWLALTETFSGDEPVMPTNKRLSYRIYHAFVVVIVN